jgi:uncharacterized protein (TIGR02598 family)
MKKNLSSTEGFSLVEVVLALGISAFALIIILGLLSAGLGANQVSMQQTEAINLAAAVVADLRQTPTTAAIAASGGSLTAVSPRYNINVTLASPPAFYLDESGNYSATLVAAAHYKVVVTLTQPLSGQRISTYGDINIGWPAAANPPLNSISTFIALDRN